MGRIAIDDVDKYGGGGNAFFQLKDDGDTENVRIMYETIEDVDAYTLHKIKVGNSERYVSCLRENHDDPLTDCPLCEAKCKTEVRLFIPLYTLSDNTIKFWERGKTFVKKLQNLFKRHKPLCGTVFEIERNGRKGDNQTSYEFYGGESDSTTLEDLPEIPEILGTYVLEKTKDELQAYVDTGKLPGEEDKKSRDVEQDGVRRRGNSNSTRRRESF